MLGNAGHEVRLWARRAEFAAELAHTRENRDYLPGTLLPESVTATADLAAALDGAQRVVVAIPSIGVREVMTEAAPLVAVRALVICATKGLERPSGHRMSEVLAETLAPAQPRLVALSGPNLSAEIAAGMPAVSVVAAAEEAAALAAQELLSNRLFRVYTNSDIIGVELSGAMKNVIALGAGISDGLGYGANAKAALLTRGMAEMARLGLALGARAATFSGIAGIGDLMATCSSPLSRNYSVGFRLGQGEAPEAIRRSMHNVAEGVFTTAAARDIARAANVEVPVTEAVYRVLYDGSSPTEEVRALMARRWRAEED